MVARQIESRDVTAIHVLDAMRTVPRHEFVPEKWRSQAYEDGPLPIGNDQTISQPYIVASMTELLEPDKTKTVLEIGTGSGYQTAVLAELFKSVTTIEYFEDLSRRAQELLDRLGYTNITYFVGDGLNPDITNDTFDGIIVTAAPRDFPESLVERLKPNGRIVIPVGDAVQTLRVASVDIDRRVSMLSLYSVRFVPLLGRSR